MCAFPCFKHPPKTLIVVVMTVVLAIMLLAPIAASAQDAGASQELRGYLEPKTGDYFILSDLSAGQELVVIAQSKSGNLDPFVGIVDSDVDGGVLLQNIRDSYALALIEGLDPTSATASVSDEIFVVWNDDSQGSSNARLEFTVPKDGDYRLLTAGSLGHSTFGDYRLLLELDVADSFQEDSRAAGDMIATLVTKIPRVFSAVDELSGVFSEDKLLTLVKVRPLSAGDSLYAYVETTDGDMRPVLTLQNYRSKPLITDNYNGESSNASLHYTAAEDTENLMLQIRPGIDISETGGAYRLLIGINQPDVLTGSAEQTETPALLSPIVVNAGIKLDQITGVDQVSENFGAVVNLRYKWDMPQLAFNPDDCQCFFQTYTPSSFEDRLEEVGASAWPITTIYNQQGRRDEQGNTIVVMSDGRTTYDVRFTATLQAPDFNFRLFPFDRQVFHIRVRQVFPEEFFVYQDLAGYSGLGEQLGEEEWLVTDWESSVDTSENKSRYNLTFWAIRHLDYYSYRIFLPLLIIILVSWAIFFLRNYEKRVDAAAGNLLLLIGFNFTISGNLPKLGYLTLLDAILITIFVVTGLVLVMNVFLKRMEVGGGRERAQQLDRYILWLYPIVYLVMIIGIGAVFFART